MTGRPRHPGALGRQHGQATVELALAMPVVMLAVLAVLQVGLVVRDQVRVQHAAREGARVAAVDPARSGARTAALGASGLDPARTSVAPRGRDGPGSLVTVTVTHRSATDLPLVGRLLPDPQLRAAVTMRVET